VGNGTAAWLAICLIAILAVIGAWDVCVAYGIAQGRTVSSLTHEWATRFPILPFLTGLLLGHLFWPVRTP